MTAHVRNLPSGARATVKDETVTFHLADARVDEVLTSGIRRYDVTIARGDLLNIVAEMVRAVRRENLEAMKDVEVLGLE